MVNRMDWLLGFIELLGFVGFFELGVQIFYKTRIHFGYFFGLYVDLLENLLCYVILIKCYVEMALNFSSRAEGAGGDRNETLKLDQVI